MNLGKLPEGRRGTALALGLAAIALALFWGGVAAPLAGWYQARARTIAGERTLAAHMAAIAATLPSAEAAAAHARRAPASGALLAGGSDALAAAALQGTMEGIARGAGASLTSIAILPGEPAGPWRRIGLRVEVEAPFAMIVRLLGAVLRGAPPMLVDDLALAGPAIAGPGVPRTIDATFTVYAFRRGGSPVPAPDERQALAQ